MDDLHQDSHAHTGLPRNTLPCAPSILKHRVSGEVCLLGHQWILRFYLEKGSVPSIYMKPNDSLDIDCSRNEGRLANRFFPEKRSLDVSLDVSLGPYRETSVSNIPLPPSKRLISVRTG